MLHLFQIKDILQVGAMSFLLLLNKIILHFHNQATPHSHSKITPLNSHMLLPHPFNPLSMWVMQPK